MGSQELDLLFFVAERFENDHFASSHKLTRRN